MARIVMVARIFVDTGENDPEEACTTMERGLDDALQSFPEGEVTGALVDHYEEPTDDEVSGYFEE